MGKSFEDKVVWVTGASSGIGEALVYEVVRQGARVVMSARRRGELERVREACAAPEGRAAIVTLDLAEHSLLGEVAERAWGQFGHIDVVVHNGGVSQRSLAAETSLEVDQRLMAINYFGPVALTKSLLPKMKARGGGQIVVVTSLTGLIGTPMRSGYAASKHALHGFFDSLRAEVAGDNILITLVCPGFVHTDVSRNALTGDGTPQGTMDEATSKGLSARACAAEIVRAVAAGRTEAYIGGTETLGVYLKRLSPALFARVIARAKVM